MEDPRLELSARASKGSFDTSTWNQLRWNMVDFDNRYGGLPQMGATLCSTAACYSWVWSNTGYILDERNMAYGRAVCLANDGNGYSVYVYYCETGNSGG